MPTLPFTAEQFFAVFASYNRSMWPWPFVLAAAAAAVVVATWLRPELGRRTVPGFLAILWIWSGVAYHLAHFARVNPAAYVFGGFFVVQGILWAWAAGRGWLDFGTARDGAGILGTIGIAYALAIYPLLGSLLGPRYPATPTFGAPCPSTIFTFGILLWAGPPVPIRLVIIPALWAVLAAPMAMRWGVLQDAAMPLIAAAAVILLTLRNRRVSHHVRQAGGSIATAAS